MHLVCKNACRNAMNACMCVSFTRLSILCFNYAHTISFMLLAHMAHVNSCIHACAPQYLNHSPILKHTPTIYN